MAELNSNIEISVKHIPEVKEMLENMKCCGNCSNLDLFHDGGAMSYCNKIDSDIINPSCVCQHWQYDLMNSESRNIDCND